MHATLTVLYFLLAAPTKGWRKKKKEPVVSPFCAANLPGSMIRTICPWITRREGSCVYGENTGWEEVVKLAHPFPSAPFPIEVSRQEAFRVLFRPRKVIPLRAMLGRLRVICRGMIHRSREMDRSIGLNRRSAALTGDPKLVKFLNFDLEYYSKHS